MLCVFGTFLILLYLLKVVEVFIRQTRRRQQDQKSPFFINIYTKRTFPEQAQFPEWKRRDQVELDERASVIWSQDEERMCSAAFSFFNWQTGCILWKHASLNKILPSMTVLILTHTSWHFALRCLLNKTHLLCCHRLVTESHLGRRRCFIWQDGQMEGLSELLWPSGPTWPDSWDRCVSVISWLLLASHTEQVYSCYCFYFKIKWKNQDQRL